MFRKQSIATCRLRTTMFGVAAAWTGQMGDTSMRSRLHGHGRPRLRRAVAVAASAAAVLGTGALAGATAASASPASSATTAGTGHHGGIQHVLLISVDGLHQQDLAWYVKTYPNSVLAGLYGHGLEYSSALTPFPSDSTPGMVAQVTGGDPRVTGEYYDDTWNHDVFPAGTTNCSGPAPGGEAAYEEFIDKNSNSLDAGEGLSGLPGSILQMTGDPNLVLNPANMPVDPDDVQADLPEPVPEGQHDLQRRARRRAADRLVGQAPGVPDVRRAIRQAGWTTSSPRRSTARPSRLPSGGSAMTGPRTTPPPCSTTGTRSRRS